jgi:hypothetical protein
LNRGGSADRRGQQQGERMHGSESYFLAPSAEADASPWPG